jgi:hypothetical protein
MADTKSANEELEKKKEPTKPNSGLVFSREAAERWLSENKTLADSESARLRFGFEPPAGPSRLEPPTPSNREEDTKIASEELEAYANSINDDMLRLLYGMRESLMAHGVGCQEPEAFFGPTIPFDEYKWGMATTGKDGEVRDHDVMLEVTLEEQAASEGKGTGVSFSFIANSMDGKIVAQFIPGNYTDQVWVEFDDKAALEARLNEFTMGDYSSLHTLVEGHFEEVAARAVES